MTLLPPSQYDFPPQIPVIEQILPWEDVQRFCHAKEYFTSRNLPMPTGAGILGCAMTKDGICYIIHTGALNVRRHELGHCNGWPKDHPQ